MANDKNNIKELVAHNDEDPTSELETLTIRHMALADLPDSETEVGARTSQKPPGDAHGDLEGDAGSASQPHASETINRLQFDIEQLRAKWLGLETEIQAREEITDNLHSELKRTKKELVNAKALLEEQQSTIASLEEEVHQREDELQTAREDNDAAYVLHEELHATSSELEGKLQEARAEIDTLNSNLDELRTAEKLAQERCNIADGEVVSLRDAEQQARDHIENLEQDLAEQRAQWQALHDEYQTQQSTMTQLTADLDMSRERIEQRSQDLDALSRKLAERDETVRELQAEIELLQQKLDEYTDEENERNRRLVSEQAGQIASDAVLISDLRAHIERVEHYADGLRVQIQERLAATDDSAARINALGTELDDARAQAAALRAEIEHERTARSELEKSLRDIEKRHAEEIRTLRFELGEAQETARQHEETSIQLASDLGDNQERRARLDDRLVRSEAAYQNEVDGLKAEIDTLNSRVRELEEELASKSEAARSLVEELAKKSRQMESIGKIEDVIHDLDSRMSERIEERPNGDRVTRLLVGNIDGQDVRFPLFKNRLTIGRTRQNDIQLKAAFVSRRHAVVLSDGDKVRVVDWGSKNGVFVNSARVSEHFLRNGDVVTIGTTDFRYEARPKRER